MDCIVLSAGEKCNNDSDNDLHFATSIMNVPFCKLMMVMVGGQNKWW